MNPWEYIYRKALMMTGDRRITKDTQKFLRWARREQFIDFQYARVLDVGCGTGHASIYCAGMGSHVIGYDIAPTAIAEAKRYAAKFEVADKTDFSVHSIAEPFDISGRSIDCVLDVMASHALSREQRNGYISEVSRVLRPGGVLFVRTLAIEGDIHARKLLEKFPADEQGMYIMPGTGIKEMPMSADNLRDDFEKYFTMHKLERKSGYMRVQGTKYKRSYWIMHATRNNERYMI